MPQAVIGLVAHVDAGKTTLAEALLYRAGAIRRQGRVDKGDAHLDTDAMERERGITIFSKQTYLDWAGTHLMLLDTPGHVDFSAEAERTLQALDYAVLIVGANDGIEGHTETLWGLLDRYRVPTFLFVNKLDLAGGELAPLMAELRGRLSAAIVDGGALADLAGHTAASPEGDGATAHGVTYSSELLEDVAAADEVALDEYLECGTVGAGTVRRLVAERKLFPCFAGSALRCEGIEGLLDGIAALIEDKAWPEAFAARVYRVSRGTHGERLAWLKVTGGTLRAKEQLSGFDGGVSWTEKVDQVRIYDADSFQIVREVPAGRVCAVPGLTRVRPGSALGAEGRGTDPALVPVLSFRVEAPGTDATVLVRALRELADEDPLLGVAWHEQLQEVHVQLMGEVQREVVARRLAVPADKVGRALADLQRMGATFGPPEVRGGRARIAGEAPASEIGSYALEVSAYSGGQGSLALEYAGYRPCHDAERVISEAAYDPQADLPNTPDSVFCSHGAGYAVRWDEVPAQAHVQVDPDRLRPWRVADEGFFSG